jgi:hypothetical protein
MKKEEINRIVSISIAISAIITLGYIFYLKTIDLRNFYRGVNFSISLVTLFWAFYFAYGWKMYILSSLFYRPNLNGTWGGKLISDWKDENGNQIPPKDFFIIIRQSFLRIHFTTLTDNFVGFSYAETFSLKKETGLKNVAYLYRKDTSQSNDEDLREGATELRLIIAENGKKLVGKYWSNTKTQGQICVEFLTEKHFDSFEEAKKIKE